MHDLKLSEKILKNLSLHQIYYLDYIMKATNYKLLNYCTKKALNNIAQNLPRYRFVIVCYSPRLKFNTRPKHGHFDPVVAINLPPTAEQFSLNPIRPHSTPTRPPQSNPTPASTPTGPAETPTDANFPRTCKKIHTLSFAYRIEITNPTKL